jgi:nitrite reductase/ring-hydroxylating ferredoxin subunit
MFLSHTNDIKNGWSIPLAVYQNLKILNNNNGQYQIFSNICPHQGSLILASMRQGIACQYHGWSWNDNGQATASGAAKICNTTRLPVTTAYVSNGLVFSKSINLDYLGIDFNSMELIEHRIDKVTANCNNIMDVFLDVDHIPVVHKDVYDKIGIHGDAIVEWDYYDWGSVQKVQATSISNSKWAAIWIAIYPGTMIEWQPGSLFITVCLPTKDDCTSVLVWKYKDSNSTTEQWVTNETIWETAWEQDQHQSSSIVKFADYKMLEESKLHFRNWLTK